MLIPEVVHPKWHVQGSTLAALNGAPQGEAAIQELMRAVDSSIPAPRRATDLPFAMPIESVYNIQVCPLLITLVLPSCSSALTMCLAHAAQVQPMRYRVCSMRFRERCSQQPGAQARMPMA